MGLIPPYILPRYLKTFVDKSGGIGAVDGKNNFTPLHERTRPTLSPLSYKFHLGIDVVE